MLCARLQQYVRPGKLGLGADTAVIFLSSFAIQLANLPRGPGCKKTLTETSPLSSMRTATISQGKALGSKGILGSDRSYQEGAPQTTPGFLVASWESTNTNLGGSIMPLAEVHRTPEEKGLAIRGDTGAC